MSLKKLVHTLAISAVAFGSLAPLSGPASAGEWRNRTAHYGGSSWDGGHTKHWRGGDRRHHGWNQGYRRHRDHTGRAIAIGAFATILGLALAAESAKVQRDYYDYED